MRKTIEISDFKMMMFLILRRQPEGQGSFLGGQGTNISLLAFGLKC